MCPLQSRRRIIYYPWSETINQKCLEQYTLGRMPVLDLELSARCTHGSCIYCDSKVGKPYPNELTLSEAIDIVEQGRKLGLQWVYICGVGEPADDEKFFGLIELLRDKGIAVSIFSNGLRFTRADIKVLRDYKVSLIVKLDSFDPNVFDRILGKSGCAEVIYRTIENLLEQGYAERNKRNETDLALSIVPTSWTIQDIPHIIEYCEENNIFPSIGELEYSGKAKGIYKDLSVSKEELLRLKREVEDILGYPYQRPMCPAVIAGLHITNTGKCVVHRDTGLSCQWFLLTEPNMVEIGDVRRDSLVRLNEKLRDYRKMQFDASMVKADSRIPNVFGGCGGKLEEILGKYVALQGQMCKLA